MEGFRVFVKDVGPFGREYGYSAIKDVEAENAASAVAVLREDPDHSWDKRDMKAFPLSDRSGWPDGKTGRLK